MDQPWTTWTKNPYLGGKAEKFAEHKMMPNKKGVRRKNAMTASCLEKMIVKYWVPCTSSEQPVDVVEAELSSLGLPAGEASDEISKRVDPAELAPSIVELRKILMSAPIRVRVTAHHTSVIAPITFRNDALLKRVSALVFYDDPCWSYLYDHPEDVIDGKNFDGNGGNHVWNK